MRALAQSGHGAGTATARSAFSALLCAMAHLTLLRAGCDGGRAMATEGDLGSYPGMTKWFSPRLLVWAAYRDVAARIFGEYADRRTSQHLADPIPADPAQRKAFAERYAFYEEKAARGELRVFKQLRRSVAENADHAV